MKPILSQFEKLHSYPKPSIQTSLSPKQGESFGIHIQKEYLKFAAAHFLIFPDGSSERLHGHNYQVEVEIEGQIAEGGLVYDFLDIKPLVKEICDSLDEHVLLPGKHPHLSIESEEDEIQVQYKHKRYVFPKNEVIILPIDNTSTERFASYILYRLYDEIDKLFPVRHIASMRVLVHESPGQFGFYRHNFQTEDSLT